MSARPQPVVQSGATIACDDSDQHDHHLYLRPELPTSPIRCPGVAEHICTFQEVEIGAEDVDEDEASALRPGMLVLAPCVCGENPLDALSMAEANLEQTQAGLDRLIVDRDMLLYHWAPTARRAQIIRYGLRPSMRPTTNASPEYLAPYVCLADTPKWAWLLSGNQHGSPCGEWDLWQVFTSNLTEPHVVPCDEENGIHEVRTMHRIYKRHLWLVGSRTSTRSP